jgi:DNA repair protein RadC
MKKRLSQVSDPVEYRLPISQWPESERPREKLIEFGAENLTDSELLAIILRTGSNKQSALCLSRNLLRKYGGFTGLAQMDVATLMNEHGVGKAKAVTISAVVCLARRMQSEESREKIQQIRSPRDVADIFGPSLRDLSVEKFQIILLNSANRVIRRVTISTGHLNASLVHPREVFKTAIVHSAAAIILMHNHPSGNAEPSKEDREITKLLVEAGKVFQIPIHDHIIITREGYTSFADRGFL